MANEGTVRKHLIDAIQESAWDAVILELVGLAADAKMSPLDLVVKIAHSVDPILKESTEEDQVDRCIAPLKLQSVKFKLANLGSNKVLDIGPDASE